jgi:hypothetical protein
MRICLLCTCSYGDTPAVFKHPESALAGDEAGEPLTFEHPERYTVRFKRDRLDCALLVEYLAMGIVVDDDAHYAEVALVRQRVIWKTRKQSLAQAKTTWMLD